jgi:hypothetical protein
MFLPNSSLFLVSVTGRTKGGTRRRNPRRKVTRKGTKGRADSPEIEDEPQVKKVVIFDRTQKSNIPPAGTGTRKKKLRRKPSNDTTVAETGIDKIVDRDEDSDDESIESFMVEPEDESKRQNQDDSNGEDFENEVENVEESRSKKPAPELETKTKPAFGESLKVGFKTRNSRNRARGRRPPGGGARTAQDHDVAVEKEAMYDNENEITDVDDDNYIEWDSGTAPTKESTNRSKNNDVPEELSCRNCDAIINQKFIKYYVEKRGDEVKKINGPFCTKLCSLEFSE